MANRRTLVACTISLVAACSSGTPASPSDLSVTPTSDLAPPPGPDLGLCADAKCQGAPFVCDPLDGVCKPDGTTTHIGDPCPADGPNAACGTMLGNYCNDENQDGFPGGYCSYEPCSTMRPCPIGSSCAGLGGFPPACWKNCAADTDCRTPDYACMDVENLRVTGPSHKVCYLPFFPCFKDKDCPQSTPHCMGAGVQQGMCTQ